MLLWVLLALLLLFLIGLAALGCYALFVSTVRQRQVDAWDESAIRGTDMERYSGKIQEAKRWLLAQEHEEVSTVSFDGLTLKAEFVKNPKPKGTILLFHGYRSQWKVDFSWSMRWYFEQGFNLLLCDQRAHMRSQGRYITYGVREHRDVSSWCAYLVSRFGQEQPLFVSGLSMGAATVLMAAGDDLPGNVRGIIADCGFTSPKEIFTAVMKTSYPHFPVRLTLFALNLFTSLFAGYRINECSTVDTLSRTKYPILLIHGKADDFVPCFMSEAGYQVIPTEKELLLVDDAVHAVSFLVDEAAYKAAVLRMLSRA